MKQGPRRQLVLKWLGISAIAFVASLYQGVAAIYVAFGEHSAELARQLSNIPGVQLLVGLQPSADIPGTLWPWAMGILFALLVLFGFSFQRFTHHVKRQKAENEARDLQNL